MEKKKEANRVCEECGCRFRKLGLRDLATTLVDPAPTFEMLAKMMRSAKCPKCGSAKVKKV